MNFWNSIVHIIFSHVLTFIWIWIFFYRKKQNRYKKNVQRDMFHQYHQKHFVFVNFVRAIDHDYFEIFKKKNFSCVCWRKTIVAFVWYFHSKTFEQINYRDSKSWIKFVWMYIYSIVYVSIWFWRYKCFKKWKYYRNFRDKFRYVFELKFDLFYVNAIYKSKWQNWFVLNA